MKSIVAVLLVLAVAASTQAYKVKFNLKSLHDDLEDFLSLLPEKEIKQVFMDYLSYDDDFGEAVDYLESDEFHTLIHEIEAIKEYQDFIDYLQSTGLDARGFIKKVKEILGFDDLLAANRPVTGLGITGGLPGFLKDVMALIPADKVKKMYADKLANSKDFAAFIAKLESKDFQNLVNLIGSNEKLVAMLKKLETKGVDVKGILQFVTDLLGIDFPFNH